MHSLFPSHPYYALFFSFAIWLSLLFVLLLNVISLISFIHWSIHSFSHSFMHSVGRSFTHSFIHVMFATIIVADNTQSPLYSSLAYSLSHTTYTATTTAANSISIFNIVVQTWPVHLQCTLFYTHIQLKRWREHINVLRSSFKMKKKHTSPNWTHV